MSDSKDKSGKQSQEGDSQGPQGGERLAKARRTQQISVLEIAKELHLDEPKVRALERNEFDVLGAPVFAKGHLRKYAQLVKVSEDDVMADYYQLNRAAGIPQVVTTRARPRREMSPGPWIAMIVVIILVATAYWWFTTPPASVEEPQLDLLSQEMTQEMTQAPASQAEEAGVDDTAVLESMTGDANASDLPTAESEAVASDAKAPEARAAAETPALSDGQVRLLVTYSGDCWTEITDALGRRLFFGLGTDGRTVELSGQAPFNVLFGDADNVSIRVNGTERAFSNAERRGRIARLTIAGS